MSTSTPPIEIRPAAARGRTQIGWLDSAHSFSFGAYRDPQRMGYRTLRVINDDRIAPGAGFGEHGHDNMEIVTWVIEGSLQHGDSLANRRELTPGEVQVMTAGSGIRHSEMNGSTTQPAHFLQVWIQPSLRDLPPRYGQATIDPAAYRNRFAPIASGLAAHEHADVLPIHQDAAILIADIQADGFAAYELKPGRGVYLQVATGSVRINEQTLSAGDGAVIESPGEVLVHGRSLAQVMLFDLA